MDSLATNNEHLGSHHKQRHVPILHRNRIKHRHGINLTMKDKFEWLWRIICLGLLIANLYLKGNFVSLETYNADKESNRKTFEGIQTILTTMEERSKVNDRQDASIADHEARIRHLERREILAPRKEP